MVYSKHYESVVKSLYYTLHITYHKNQLSILMDVINLQYLHTDTIPNIGAILEAKLPSIFYCQCFNNEHIPFSEELYHTEFGHLFEHILLEYLCIGKLQYGSKSAEYSGWTSWNWKRDKRGTFHILIDSAFEEMQNFNIALQKTIRLVDELITPQQIATSYGYLSDR